MVNAPQISLKVIVTVHFILTVWASMMQNFLPVSYIYMNAFILAFGFWAIVAPESTDSLFMFLNLHVLSFVMDIIFLAAFNSHAHSYYEHGSGYSQVNTYRFALGMAVVNLLLKPFTSFVLYRLHQERGGAYGDFSIAGIPNFGGSSGIRSGGTGYENIDQPVPSLDSGSPTHGIDHDPRIP